MLVTDESGTLIECVYFMFMRTRRSRRDLITVVSARSARGLDANPLSSPVCTGVETISDLCSASKSVCQS